MGLFFESTIDSGFDREFVNAKNEQEPQGKRAFGSKNYPDSSCQHL